MDSDNEEIEEMFYEEEREENSYRQQQEELANKDTLLTFNKHTDSVFCSDINKDDTLAVTGGEDDKAYVWSTTTGEIDFECLGHKDSVTHAVFSHDGQYIATGDMSGLVQVWSVNEKKLTGTIEETELEWLKWHQKTNAIFCGFGSGLISIWDVGTNIRKILFDGKEDGCVDGFILSNNKSLLSCYKSGELRLWNIVSGTTFWVNSHFESIFNVRANQNDTLAICCPGAELIDLSTGKLIKKILYKETSIEVSLFLNELNALITGSLSNWLHIWEQRDEMLLAFSMSVSAPITTIEQIGEEKVAIGLTGGLIYIINAKSRQCEYSLAGHDMNILSLSKFHHSNKILSTSDDETAKVLQIRDVT